MANYNIKYILQIRFILVPKSVAKTLYIK